MTSGSYLVLHTYIIKLCIRRREGYEFMVGPPKVINKKVDDKLQEPYEVIFYFSFTSLAVRRRK